MHARITRRFRDLDKPPTTATTRAQLGRFASVGDQVWSSLLPERGCLPKYRAIIIEAGSGTGKTTELQLQHEHLKALGVPSFLFVARDLLRIGLQSSLSNYDARRFREWLATSELAIVFVDAIDEVYLDHRASVDVFRELERDIDPRTSDLILVVSARTGSWSPAETTHLERFAQVARSREDVADSDASTLADEATEREPKVKHVTFEPLDRTDIRSLAEFYGVGNSERFMKAFNDNEVADLADTRPRDVRAFVEFWKHHQNFGSWSDIVKWQVILTYSELNPVRRRRELSLVEYAAGLKRVSAASTLCKSSHVILPTAPYIPGAVHASELFPDWTPAKLDELFSSPLFVPKGESAVQLAQGTFAQCLTALWFESRYRSDLDVEVIRQNIFSQVPGYSGLRLADSRRAVAGWLASLVPQVRKILVAIAPDVLLHFGDPEKLDASEVEAALRQMVALKAIRHWEWPSQGTLARLARPELEGAVMKLLCSENDPDIIWHLLHIVEAGSYKSCLPRVRELALLDDKAGIAHATSVRIIAKLGSGPDKASLKSLLNSGSCETRAVLISTLFPDLITPDECAEALVRGCNYSMALAFAGRCKVLDATDLERVLEAIDTVVSPNARHIDSERSRDFNEASESALAHVACSALISRLEKGVNGEVPLFLRRLPMKIQLIAEFQYMDSEQIEKLNAALRERPLVLQAVWQEKLAILRRDKHLHDHSSNAVAPIAVEDYDWLYVESARDENGDVRDYIIFAIRNSYSRLGTPLASSVRDSMSAPVRALLDSCDADRKSAELNRLQREARIHQEAQESRANNREVFASRLENIRKGTDRDALWWAWNHLKSSPVERVRINAVRLAELVGDDYAQDFLTGLTSMWKSCAAMIAPARGDQLSADVLMALTGLSVEYQRLGSFASFSAVDAVAAARIAMHELNAFPPWLGDLVEHRDIVRKVLVEAISSEWERTSEHHGVLRFAPREPSSVASLIQDVVLELATIKPPGHTKTIEYATDALLMGPSCPPGIAILAEKWTIASEDRPDDCVQWLRLWAHTAPEESARWLQSARSLNPQASLELVERLAGLLGEDFDYESDRRVSQFFTPSGLRAWLPLLVEAIRPERDVSPKGVHIVGEREQAQKLRDKCLSALAQDGTPESLGVLQLLLGQRDTSSFRDRLEFAIDTHGRCAAEKTAEAWPIDNVLEYESGRDIVPRSINGLFELVRRHLRQIGESQEAGDFSHKELFVFERRSDGKSSRMELSVQRWVAATLQLMARGVYSVDREGEVQDENRMDICARIPGIGRLPIEIKPIGRYTEKSLKDTIEQQLIGNYMRPARVTHGILLLVQMTTRTHRVGGKDGRSYNDLCRSLQQYADAFAVTEGRVVGVESMSLAANRERLGA